MPQSPEKDSVAKHISYLIKYESQGNQVFITYVLLFLVFYVFKYSETILY